MRTFTRKTNRSAGVIGDKVEAVDVNELQEAIEDLQSGDLTIPHIQSALDAIPDDVEDVTHMRVGIYNVLDYGAVAIASTDNTAAFLAAKAARTTAGSGYVRIPAGTYGLAGEVDFSDCPVRGDGWENTTIIALDTDARLIIASSYDTSGGIHVDGGNIAEYGVHFVDSAGGYYPHWYVENCTKDGVTFNNVQNAIIPLLSVATSGRHNLIIRNGCGSLIFDHVESTGADYGHYIWVTEDGVLPTGATSSGNAEPGSILFRQGLCEYGVGPESGTATGGTATTLVDSSATWTVNQWTNAWVTMDPGGASQEARRVVSNTATTLTVDDDWSLTPTTETYKIVFASIRVDAGNAITFDKFGILSHFDTADAEAPNLEVDRESGNGSTQSSVLLHDCVIQGADADATIGAVVRGTSAVLRTDVTTAFSSLLHGIVLDGPSGAVFGALPRMSATTNPVTLRNSANFYNQASALVMGTHYDFRPYDAADAFIAAQVDGDGAPRMIQYASGKVEWGSGSAGLDTNLYRDGANALRTDDGFQLPGTYLLPLRLGDYRLWVNPGDGKLYIKSSAPANATDGTVVGTQS